MERFKHIEDLGTGGFGRVWRAHDEVLGRDVAIKAIRSDGLSPLAKKALMEEAKILSKMVHENIVQIYDVLRADRPHLIMEYVAGQTLQEILAERALKQRWVSCEEARSIFNQLLMGLSFAHGRNVIHRDIKPANLIVANDGTLKIADFGLARSLKLKHGEASGYVRTNFGGTMNFMSPEQACNKKLDTRTDVFSAGIVGYILFSGRHPFAHPSAIPSVVSLIKDPGYSAADLTQSEASWTAREKEVIMRMLSKKPADRFRSATEALEQFADDGLSVICRECQSSTNAENRYCGKCGASLYSRVERTQPELKGKRHESNLLVEEGLRALEEKPRD